MRLLLVESNFLIGDAVCDHIAARGWSVQWDASLQSARISLASGSFDVMCLDRILSDGDGFDILRAEGVKRPVVVLSAFDGIQDQLEAYRLGAFDYLRKPIDLDALAHRLQLAFLAKGHTISTADLYRQAQ